MRKLYDYILSSDCYKVRLMLSLLGLEHQRQAVDYFPGREHRSLPFLALNPSGELPVLDDGGRILCGAEAILIHLADAYAHDGNWLPRDQRFEAITNWLDFARTKLASFGQARMVSMLGEDGDLDELKTKGRAALRILEDHLTDGQFSGGEWIVGETPTIADIAVFPAVALGHDCGIGHEDYPAINLWQRRVRALPRFVSMPGIPDYF